MPEEINRLCTDAISDLLFTTDILAVENLRNEGVASEKIHFVGNTMIDTLRQQIDQARQLPLPDGLVPGQYAVLTLHRPANVDSPDRLVPIIGAINAIAGRIPVVFPVHPRTALQLKDLDLHPRLRTVEPVDQTMVPANTDVGYELIVVGYYPWRYSGTDPTGASASTPLNLKPGQKMKIEVKLRPMPK